MMILQRRKNGGETLKENDVREVGDEPEKCFRDQRAYKTNRDSSPKILKMNLSEEQAARRPSLDILFGRRVLRICLEAVIRSLSPIH
jgi:hypothetical protein